MMGKTNFLGVIFLISTMNIIAWDFKTKLSSIYDEEDRNILHYMVMKNGQLAKIANSTSSERVKDRIWCVKKLSDDEKATYAAAAILKYGSEMIYAPDNDLKSPLDYTEKNKYISNNLKSVIEAAKYFDDKLKYSDDDAKKSLYYNAAKKLREFKSRNTIFI